MAVLGGPGSGCARRRPLTDRYEDRGEAAWLAAVPAAGGVWEISPARLRVLRLIRTGAGADGLVVSRNGRVLYVANRSAGTVSVLSFRRHRIVRTWRIPGGGSPDMGDVSANGRVLWLAGRFNAEVYAIETRSGRLVRRILVGASPHGVSVWPQPGR
jgi:DNA-binding beta-propeller fold protein YncE